MRVLIDGRPLYDGHSRHRGIGVFLRSLLERLAPISDLSLAALVTAGTETPVGVQPIRVRRIEPKRLEALEHSVRLSIEIGRAKPDVFHSPALEPPMRSARPWVQTLHDVTPLVYDDPFFRREADRWKRLFGRMRAADAVVAVSRYSAEMAVKIVGIDPARVHVVPNGVDPAFSSVRRAPADPPFVLSVGTLNPWREAEIAALLARASHPERVELLGLVEQDELERLYGGATALILSSRCEGFGLPAIEAMASGTPVVSFRNTALTDVVSDGGELIADGDADAMADAVASLIDDPVRWGDLSARGRDRARAFDWNDAATAYAQIYRAVAGSRRSRAS